MSSTVQSRIAARIDAQAIASLPLFLNDIQLRIFMTLLMGEHDETGRALASYAAVMQSALDHYTSPDPGPGALSAEGRERSLATLRNHLDLSQAIAKVMLTYGKSHEFGRYVEQGNAVYNAVFDATKAAVDARFALNVA